MKAVVDTNVTIAANGRDTHASLACQMNCINLLTGLASKKTVDQVFIDDRDLILGEYKKHLNYKGQPGVGDLFFKFLHDHMFLDRKVRRVAVTPDPNEARGFTELPINAMDKSDRIFLAVALVTKATVFNALDRDWHEQAGLIDELGVKVTQLCPEHGRAQPCV